MCKLAAHVSCRATRLTHYIYLHKRCPWARKQPLTKSCSNCRPTYWCGRWTHLQTQVTSTSATPNTSVDLIYAAHRVRLKQLTHRTYNRHVLRHKERKRYHPRKFSTLQWNRPYLLSTHRFHQSNCRYLQRLTHNMNLAYPSLHSYESRQSQATSPQPRAFRYT